MNYKYNYMLMIVAFVAISVSSCKKSFLKEELNNDPTSLANADPKVLLPTAISNMAYFYGGDFARIDAMLTQQTTGAGNQWFAMQNYDFVNSDFDNCWNSTYVTTLNSLKKMGDYSKEKKLYHYEGVSKVLSAFAFSVVVDHWGDAPFTEAYKAPENFQPKYDAGSAVYSSIITLLNDAEILLAKTDEGRVPGAEDLLFAGDMESWINFSHAIKARLYLHKKEFTLAQSELVLANGIDVKFNFTSPGSGPMNQFDDQRTGDLEYKNSYLYNEMNSIKDLRLYNYVDTASGRLGDWLNTASQPVYFISAMEQKFIEAEILARSGDINASEVLTEAVAISYTNIFNDSIGTANALTAYPYNNADPIANRLKSVMMQKYFAMFFQPESFADWRRTDIPNLIPNSGTAIPRRYLYPNDEKTTNPNTPTVTLYSPRVFWDN